MNNTPFYPYLFPTYQRPMTIYQAVPNPARPTHYYYAPFAQPTISSTFSSGIVITPLKVLSEMEVNVKKWVSEQWVTAGEKAQEVADKILSSHQHKTTSVFLTYSMLTNLPKAIGALNHLYLFSVNENILTTLPDEIGNLTNLVKLYVNCNILTTLPESIRNLTQLELIEVDNNQLTKIPQGFSELKNLKRCVLSNNEISVIPDFFGDFVHLQELCLNKNKIKKIPDSLGNLSKLRILKLHNNELESLPEAIGNLSELIEMYLSHNQLKCLPNSIGNLSNLRVLEVNNNYLQQIPETIRGASSLLRINLNNNEITYLPNIFEDLLGIGALHCSNNALRSLPPSLGFLLLLENLYVSNNPDLNSLPMTLGNCSILRFLDIRGTAIPEAEKIAILARIQENKGTQDELHFLKLRLATWNAYSNKKRDFSFFETLFTNEQKKKINMLLGLLESSADFQDRRRELAVLVCDLLESIRDLEEFKETFFALLDDNLDCCSDRASMLLNLIYTQWKIESMSENATDHEKITLLISAAKALTFRNFISEKIRVYERSGSIQRESVEIYLYLETKLSKELGLLSVINKMIYPHVGAREDILKEKDLIQHVNEHYIETLVELTAFEKILEKNQKYREEHQLIKNAAEKEMEKVEDGMEQYESEQTYKDALDFVMKQCKKDILELRKKYVHEMMNSN